MTVAELIAELQQWPQDQEVAAGPNSHYLGPILPVKAVNMLYGWLLTEEVSN